MRMNDNPALNQRYVIEYLRASQGKLAGHGRDLADSYEHRQALKLEPPYPLETAALLHNRLGELARLDKHRDVAQEAVANAAQSTILKPYGLSYYDFVIADNWWMRKAALALLAGDDRVLRTFEGIGTGTEAAADDDASDDTDTDGVDANVQVGNDVQVGKNVHVGGHEAKSKH